jgi:hypothetical protein
LKRTRDKTKLAPKESQRADLEEKRHQARFLLVTGFITGLEFKEIEAGLRNPSDCFSLKEGHFNGHPIIEVLKNGGPVHPFDRHFRFGVRKAQMMLACVNILGEFWRADRGEKLRFETQEITDDRHGVQVRISVEMNPYFIYSTGVRIETPWLHLEALRPPNEHIGLGSSKCRAIFTVKKGLEDWLQQQGR